MDIILSYGLTVLRYIFTHFTELQRLLFIEYTMYEFIILWERRVSTSTPYYNFSLHNYIG